MAAARPPTRRPHQIPVSAIGLTVGWNRIRYLRLTGKAKNLFDRMPPFSATDATNNNFAQMGFASMHTNRGRFFQLAAEYAFR